MGNFFNNEPKILKINYQSSYISYINIHLEQNVDLKTWFLRIFFWTICRNQTDYNFFFLHSLANKGLDIINQHIILQKSAKSGIPPQFKEVITKISLFLITISCYNYTTPIAIKLSNNKHVFQDLNIQV